MAATIMDSRLPQQAPPPEWKSTADLDSTSDLHDEHTSDLDATTSDVSDGAAPLSSQALASDTQDVNTAGSPPPLLEEDEARAGESSPAASDADRAQTLAPGAILQDRYLIEELLGVGGVAAVYRARDMQSSAGAQRNAQVAIKTPRPELHDRARASLRMAHEYEHTRALSHPNIVRAFDLYIGSEPSFMTMELLEGQLLSTLLRERRNFSSSAQIQRILQSCARALAHAHERQVVHGDFKPGNVFVGRDGAITVIDFGAASAIGGDDSRIAAGTPAYGSPEVLSGETPEVRDDVFSFACVAYELLTGQHPFERRSSLQARDDGIVPPRAWSLSASQWLSLLSALSWRREQRPADIEALAASLATEPTAGASSIAATNPSSGAKPVSRAPPESPDELMPRQRSWGFFVFVACALAVTYVATQRQDVPGAQTRTAEVAFSGAAELPRIPGGLLASTPGGVSSSESVLTRTSNVSTPVATSSSPEDIVDALETESPPAAVARKTAAPALSRLSFDSGQIETSEGSVAAVFVVARSPPLTGRSRAQWRVMSGSAEAGVDFVDASGTIEFLEGQTQRAIYVPLHNDAIKEGNETFTLELSSPTGARLGETTSVEATILDDD